MIRKELPLTVAYKSITYCGYLLCIIFVCFCISILFEKKLDQKSHPQIVSLDEDIHIEWSLPPHCFSLQKQTYSIPFDKLEKEILFLGKTPAPDQKILLSIRQSGSRKLTLPCEKVYLIYKEEQLHFSEVKTPLSIFADFLNDHLVEITATFDPYVCLSRITNLNNTHWFTKTKETQYTISNNDSLIHTSMFQSLYKARWWGLDHLFISSPQDERDLARSGQRLEVIYGQDKEILYVDCDQYLVWEKDSWKSRSLNEEDIYSNYMARIENIYIDKLELTLWDAKQLPIHTFFLPMQTPASELPSVEILSNIKRRTPTVASFLLGKKRITMKKGDFAIETPHGWRVTDIKKEKNYVFSSNILGSLFVFDGMEVQDSTLYFLGRIFDSMQTSYQSIKIPIVYNKRKTRKNKAYFQKFDYHR